MSDGYNLKTKSDVVSILKKSQSASHTILGFIEKLRKGKRSDFVDYMINEAKINTIRLIAEGEVNLQPLHLVVLYMYTMDFSLYQQVNLTLSNWDQ